MSNIQYIGARYVIKVYENSQNQNSAEWEANTSYEPLTMVTYNNSSYLSKKDVAATVGNPAQNPEYWVITGAYNGQIAFLQQQIYDITQSLERKYIIIGDSYCGNLGGYTNGIGSAIEAALNLTHGENSFIYARGGAGFIGNSQGKTFNDLVDDSYTELFNIADEITDVLILGGANDADGTAYPTINTAKTTCLNNILTKYPNAIIHIGVVSGFRSSTQRAYLNDIVKYVYYYPSVERRVHYLKSCSLPMLLTRNFNDDVHPNNNGVAAIALAVASNFNTTAYHLYRSYMNFTYDVTASTPLIIDVHCDNYAISLCCSGGSINGSFDIIWNTGADITIGTVTDSIASNSAITDMLIPVDLEAFVSGTGFIQLKGELVFIWESDAMKCHLVINTGTAGTVTATNIRIAPFNVIIKE